MKKRIIKAGILLAVFLLGVAGFSCLMNQKGTDNKTDMETAVMPVMAMLLGDTEVNRMYGYAQEMETDYLRDTLTPVGTDKTLGVSITPNGQEIDSLVYEIRTFDGDKVVENDKIKTFQEQADGKLTAEFTLKKSILMNQEYALVLTLNTEEGSWNYYTRLIQRAGLNTQKYLDFVSSFYTKTFSKDNEGDLSAYMESDQSAGNNSFYDLNIHADMDMLTWGLLAPQISRPGIPSIKEINENTGSVSITYSITAENENGEVEHYQVEEFYRMRYDQTRIRLLDFKRSAKQVLTTEQTVASGGRLNLGVTDREVQYKVSEDGGIVAFVQQGDLWAYNIETNKLTRIFTFRDAGSNDERNDYDQHDIQIVRIEENGDINKALKQFEKTSIALEENNNFYNHITNIAIADNPVEADLNTRKFAISLSKHFIISGYNRISNIETEEALPDLNITINEWRGLTKNGSNELELQKSLDNFLEDELHDEVYSDHLFNIKMLIAIIIGLVGIFLTLKQPILAAIIFSVVLIFNIVEFLRAYSKRESKIKQLNEIKKQHKTLLSNIIAEIVDYYFIYKDSKKDRDNFINYINSLNYEDYIKNNNKRNIIINGGK